MSKLDTVVRGGLIENMLISPKQTRLIVSLLDEPVSYDTFTSLDPTVRATTGEYFIKYIPESIRPGDKRAFIIGHDLYGFKTKVYNLSHFNRLVQRLPELAWLVRNTNYDPGLFEVAVQHPGMPIPFALNAVSYCDMIQQKAKEKGLDIDNRPLIAYRCSGKDYHEKYEPMNKFCYVPPKSEYVSVIMEEENNIKEE